MNLDALFISLFGYDKLWNIDMSFWASMALIGLVVVIMNVVYWNMKPDEVTNK